MIQPADRIWRAAVHTFRDQRCRDALTALMRCKHTAAKRRTDHDQLWPTVQLSWVQGGIRPGTSVGKLIHDIRISANRKHSGS